MWVGMALIVASMFGPYQADTPRNMLTMFIDISRVEGPTVLLGPSLIVAVILTVPVVLKHRNSYAMTAILRLGQLLILLPPPMMICFDRADFAWGMNVLAAGCLILWTATACPRVPIANAARGFLVLPLAPGK
jgi:hypothetical protein